VVDDEHRPVPPGVFGARVLVTVLFSRTLPLIRYEMSDSVRLAPSHDCPCGRPYRLIDGIQGRSQEVLRFPSRHGGERTVQPIVFHHAMDGVDAAGWQIVQRPDDLEILLVRPHRVDIAALATQVRSALAGQGAVAPPVAIREVASIPRTAAGKAPLITRAD
jgi:phenylacetate-coenzyme A ligase PaaK-like adenylate-forming protein